MCLLYKGSTAVGMPNFQDTFKTRKQSIISAFSICIIAPLKVINKKNKKNNSKVIVSLSAG